MFWLDIVSQVSFPSFASYLSWVFFYTNLERIIAYTHLGNEICAASFRHHKVSELYFVGQGLAYTLCQETLCAYFVSGDTLCLAHINYVGNLVVSVH